MPTVKCQICDKRFYVKPSHKKRGWGKYCSTICRSKAQLKGQFVHCSICNKTIYRSPKMLAHSKSGNYFCTKYCQTLWRNSLYTGEDHANWKSGVSIYRKILIKNKIKPVCAHCKTKDKRILNAHHVDHDRKNNKLENLIWLCLNCHFLVHHDKIIDNKVRKLIV